MGAGSELCGRFYAACVRPALAGADMPHAAALVGRGSEVLGYDDDLSHDHDWVARVAVFLDDRSPDVLIDDVRQKVEGCVPPSFEGVPTQLEVTTWHEYVGRTIGLDVGHLTGLELLSVPEASLVRVASAQVYEDGIGLDDLIARVRYYPHDVWLYLMAACWWRLHPEVNLVGRAGSTGATVGATMITATLVREIVNLCFLLERTYQPYAKWVGRAFSELAIYDAIAGPLLSASRAADWREAERALLTAYETVAAAQNNLGVCAHVEPVVTQLWGRPFRSLWGDFPSALMAQVSDREVQALGRAAPSGVEGLRNMMIRPQRRHIIAEAIRELAAST